MRKTTGARKSSRILITVGGRSMTRCQWARELGITRGAIHFREKKFGETPQEAVWHFYYKPDAGELRRMRECKTIAVGVAKNLKELTDLTKAVMDSAGRLHGLLRKVSSKIIT